MKERKLNERNIEVIDDKKANRKAPHFREESISGILTKVRFTMYINICLLELNVFQTVCDCQLYPA